MIKTRSDLSRALDTSALERSSPEDENEEATRS